MNKFNLYHLVLASTLVIIYSETVFAGGVAAPIRTVPTLGEWGMIGTAIVLGIAGIYKIFRRK